MEAKIVEAKIVDKKKKKKSQMMILMKGGSRPQVV